PSVAGPRFTRPFMAGVSTPFVGSAQFKRRKLMLELFTICAVALLHSAVVRADDTSQPAGIPTACASPSQEVNEKGFVSIGGIDQWVTVKGDSCANPIILFLHGGPGNPLSPYSDEVYGAWAKDFTLVQWDQR